jgi:ATP-binding cassette subfamily B multidrug efflux pump
MGLFSFFEELIEPTAPPSMRALPSRLVSFYWYFLHQIGWLAVFLVLAGVMVAIVDAAIPAFLGQLVTLVSTHTPGTLLVSAWPTLIGMTVVVIVVRPCALLLQALVTSQTLAPGLGNLIRWQSHWHVMRQSWSFFQDQFAGSLANRVVQTGPSLRETVILGANAVWYIVVYGSSAVVLLAASDPRLTIPTVVWFAFYALLIWYFVPRIRRRSREVSTVRSRLTGRAVDCYANITTVMLYSRAENEDDVIRDAIDEHTLSYRRHLRLTTLLSFSIAVLNSALIVSTGVIALMLWMRGRIPVGTIAMALPLAWQMSNIAGWVAQNATMLFENMGAVEDGIVSITSPLPPSANPAGAELQVREGAIAFENVGFHYVPGLPILQDMDFTVAPGEHVGLAGVSGSGKSTLVHLLLRFFELKAGRILIDGQDIAGVTPESLRRQIALVTQDTSILNRSIRDNIRLGKFDASEEEIRDAARRAGALQFIEEIRDTEGNRGFEAHVGDRGVKLSGGQKQRIAIARAILKNAPILVLDEATSALDSDTEAAVQEQLEELMRGRTVIAIAHRPSTLAHMDRVLVLRDGTLFKSVLMRHNAR